MVQLNSKGNYIAGRFQEVKESNGKWVSKSPADLSDILGEVHYSYQSADKAVESARGALKTWKKKTTEERASYLKKYQQALKKIEPQLAEVIAREAGKPLWEAKQEVSTMIGKVDATLNDGLKLVADYEISNIMENTLGVCKHRPLGVCVVIGPFNFPGHLANGHIVPALATGNTVIFKPSEKTPMVGQLMAEAFHEAGFPEGVFNLVQGEKEVGRRLVVHEGIDVVLFTGSYEVGLKIKKDTLEQYWKLLALEMGGKNSVIVCEDANLDLAIQESLVGAYITAGQRCSATSKVLVHKSLYDQFVEKFHEKAKSFKIGHVLEDNVFMGPLIDSFAVEKYLKFIGIAQREGCEVIMRGKQLDTDKKGFYVTPSICLVKDNAIPTVAKSVYQQTEIFGPNVAIYSYEDQNQACEIANLSQYGLVASIFTASKERYTEIADEMKVGLINWNRGTIGASAKLPFGGTKKSGNHFPTAVSATKACVYPVSTLEIPEPQKPKPLPGM